MSKNAISPVLVNVAGVALGLFLTAYVVRDTFSASTLPPCSASYPEATEFTLNSSDRVPLSTIELQARAGANEWGVLENAQVTAMDGAPSPLVLKVNLPKGSTSMYQTEMKPGGMSFRWQPKGMEGATSACLSYGLFVPAEFDFGDGGELPGVFGGKGYEPLVQADGENGFASRLKWANDGKGELGLQAPYETNGRFSYSIPGLDFTIPRERWVTIEQETVLNTPGEANGIARIWIDGVLKIEQTEVVWRASDGLTLKGVVNDVWYGGLDSTSNAPADTFLALTPAAIRWK